MKLKKVIILLLIIVLAIIGGFYGVKKYLFPYEYSDIVNECSEKYEVDPLLVLAVIKTESNFNESAESNRGAKGLMQVMDKTGEWIAPMIGIEDFTPDMLFEPKHNIEIGSWYLNNLLSEFGDLSLAIAAYNGGSGNVTNWLMDPEYSSDGQSLTYIPFKETKKYVDKVNVNYSIYKFFYR